MVYISILLSIIFFVLALIHFNWVFGGNWGFKKAIPTTSEGKEVLNPKPLDSFIVAAGLTFFGVVYLNLSSIIHLNFPKWISTYVTWIIPSIFLIRAIGDFKYVGFFKKVKDTEFAWYDTRVFSPLCLTICLLGLKIAYDLNFNS